MKTVLLASLLSFSMCRTHRDTNATVIKDCTGSYLRIEGKDYHICNREKTDNIADGTPVTADYKKISSCNGTAKDDIVCLMVHANEGWIEIKSITP